MTEDKVIYNIKVPPSKKREIQELVKRASVLWYIKKSYDPEVWEVIYEALRLLVKELEQ